MNILDQITRNKRRELSAQEQMLPTALLRELCRDCTRPTNSMRRSVLSGSGVIAEFKRRSPSKGEIAPMADVESVVTAYERARASACSVLTDTRYFGGSVDDLRVARAATRLPILRKDFIIDSRQIYQARLDGADAVLLIASIISPGECRQFTDLAHSLGLEVLLELRSPHQLHYAADDIDLVGVNNRDLTDFATDLAHSLGLVRKLPAASVKIAESGITSAADITRLRQAGFDGFLVGEALMRSSDPSTIISHASL